MKATLEFTLPEEKEEHLVAVKAGAMQGAICDFLEDVRSKRKHGNFTEDELEILDWVHKVAHEYFGEFYDL